MKLRTQDIVVLSTVSGRNCPCTGHRKAQLCRRATYLRLGCVLRLETTATSCSSCVLPGLVVFAIGLAMASGIGGFDLDIHWLLEAKEDFQVARERLVRRGCLVCDRSNSCVTRASIT
jgi:hypothetical protein